MSRAKSIGLRKKPGRNPSNHHNRKPRLLKSSQASRRNRMKQDHAASVAVAAGVGAASRVASLQLEMSSSQFPIVVRKRRSLRNSRRRFKPQKLCRHSVGIVRQRLLSFPVSRFQSMAAHQAPKAQRLHQNRRRRAARRVHSSPRR